MTKLLSAAAAACVILFGTGSASAQSDQELKEMAATYINLAGHLCATVKSIRSLELKNTYEITCIEYRGGAKTVDYIFAIRGDRVVVEKR